MAAGRLLAEQTAEPPYRVAPGLFDVSRPDDLGLKPVPGERTVTVFAPHPGTAQFNNGVVLLPFKGQLFAQWQSSATDEDAPDTRVVCSRSGDGEHWSEPVTLVPPGGAALHSSGGWWTDGKTLVAYINVWPGDLRAGGHTEYLTSADGLHWSEPRRVLDRNGAPVEGIIEQDVHALPDGRIITAFHLQPGLVATPFFTDDPTGTGGWTKGVMPNLPHAGPQSRELEPGWFVRRDGGIVMVFRDQESGFRQLASVSTDRGATWTTPVPTGMPDSRAKQSAGNLPDGTAFLVNEPSGNATRIPLAVTLSRDGRVFDRAFSLRTGGADLQPLRHPGKAKRPGYHYPKSIVWSGRLWVAYTTNKEDVQLTTIPLAGLTAGAAGESFADFTPDGGWCWFSDPRALARDGRTYAGWVTVDGSIAVGAWDHATGRIATQVLHPALERDDHDNPALLFLPDGRLAAFYSRHAKGDMLLRVTTRPGDITEWTPERSLGFAVPERGMKGTTYANPVLLAAEADALYVFWRGSDFKPTFAVSRDLGETWSAPRTLIARPGADNTNRPYLKLCSDGAGRIDFAFTDGHPRDEPVNSVYYVRYEHGGFFKADGTRLGGMADLPLDPARCDRVYAGANLGRAWVWDIAIAPDGRPAIAFTRLPAETDHHYEFGRWDGTAWKISEICPAGGWFPQTPPGRKEREPHYSGGMSLDQADPFTLYTSRSIDGVFEIERWHSADAGATWTSRPVTEHSRHDNVRPFAVRNSAGGGGPEVLWLGIGRYVHYTDFQTALKAATRPKQE